MSRLTVDKERAVVVHKDFGTLVNGLATALLPRGGGLVQEDTIAGDMCRRVHLRDVQVLRRLVRTVRPSRPNEVPAITWRQATCSDQTAEVVGTHSLLGSFWYYSWTFVGNVRDRRSSRGTYDQDGAINCPVVVWRGDLADEL